MPQLSLLQGSPFAFPGRNAGFDPGHIAAKGISGVHGLSAVAAPNGAFQNLVTGAVPVMAGTFTTPVSNFGPAVLTGATNVQGKFTGTTVIDTSATLAVIVSGVSGAGVLIATEATNNGGFNLTTGAGTVVLTLPFVVSLTSGFSMADGKPYFLAASKGPNTAANFVLVNLLTGATRTAVIANAQTTARSVTANTSMCSMTGVGSGSGVSFYAGMFSPTFLSMPALLAWAADPWAFWYPRSVLYSLNRVGSLTPAGTSYAMLVGRVH